MGKALGQAIEELITLVAIGLLVVAVPLYGFYYFVRGKLTIAWRRWMTKQFLHSYGTEGADAIK